ncbi:hypothetical protein F9S83_23925 [Escherichia coli]|nr:hypothetical protein [Escherichia coli]EFH4581746.1 hypothetical protein [Escherichia coli]EFH4731606.1 hypothetical protein [Escherichia coli]EFH9618423.1 hypothetical protein [Escherichia coli]
MKTPGLQRPFRSRRLCRAVACAPGIPAKRRRDVRPTPDGVVTGAFLPSPSGAMPYRFSPVAGGKKQPQPSPPVQG